MLPSMMPMTPQEYGEAAEKGRRIAALNMRDPETRARVEARFGHDYCVNRYPEAYIPELGGWQETPRLYSVLGKR